MRKKNKFFHPQLMPSDRDMNKRWAVYWYEPTHNGAGSVRKREYGRLNRLHTLTERLKEMNRIFDLVASKSVGGESRSCLLQELERRRPMYRKKTYQHLKSMVKIFHAWLGKRKDFAIGTNEGEAFIAHLLETRAPMTAISYRQKLHTLYEFWAAEDPARVNPFKAVLKIPAQCQSLSYFSHDQARAITELAARKDPQLWLSIQLLFFCFIRPGEQRALRIAHLRPDFNYIEIPGSISKNKRTAKVVIPEPLLPAIRELSRYKPDLFVFGSHGRPGSVQLGHNTLNRRHRMILDELQIEGRFALYSWKHTGVVRAVQAGLNIRDIQNQLRHHSLDMVQEYLKGLGVLQSEELRYNFPRIGG